jgi:hypothetical protein
MNNVEKLYYRKIAAQVIKQHEQDLQFLESMNLDDATKKDAELHSIFIDYQCGNAERLRYEIDELMKFINDHLRPDPNNNN